MLKILQMMKIRDFAAGSHHAAMVDELGRVFTWGAGSYGRCELSVCSVDSSDGLEAEELRM